MSFDYVGLQKIRRLLIFRYTTTSRGGNYRAGVETRPQPDSAPTRRHPRFWFSQLGNLGISAFFRYIYKLYIKPDTKEREVRRSVARGRPGLCHVEAKIMDGISPQRKIALGERWAFPRFLPNSTISTCERHDTLPGGASLLRASAVRVNHNSDSI